MEDLQCNSCQASNFGPTKRLDTLKKSRLVEYDTKYYDGTLAKLFDDKDYCLIRCQSCGHYQYTTNIPDDKLGLMYAKHASFKLSQKSVKFSEGVNRVRKYAAPLLTHLKTRSPENPSLLDYGAGAGTWSKIALELGFDVTTYEPHAMRSDESFDVLTDWKDVVAKNYDVIICNQVMEHVKFPNEVASRFQAVAKAKSLVYCAVPNAGAISEKEIYDTWPYDGKRSHILAPFQHLNGFTQASLVHCLLQHGFVAKPTDNFRWTPRGLKNLLALMTKGAVPSLSTTSIIFRSSKKN